MRLLPMMFLFVCIMFNAVVLFAQQEPNRANKRTLISTDAAASRQEAEAVNKGLEAELEKSNAEVEQIRVKAEKQAIDDNKMAEKDLEISIQEFQKEKFPVAIEEEKSSEGK